MSSKILVAYASKWGSMADVAKFIGDALTDHGAEVTIQPVESVLSAAPYDVVMLGSPIEDENCMAQVKRFILDHLPALSQRPVIYFISCLRLGQVVGETLPDLPIYVDPVFGEPRPKAELSYPERKRIHHLKYYTWVEQQGKTYEEIQAQWYEDEYWTGVQTQAPQIDALIEAFNAKVGLV